MPRPAILLGILLAACGEGQPPLDLSIPTLPEGATRLQMPDSPPGRLWQYRLEVTSRARKSVGLEAVLEPPAQEGVAVRLAGETEIPREAIGRPTLVVVAPTAMGRFGGRIRISSPDLPGWSHFYEFEGEVVPGMLTGRMLQARPGGLDLGMLRPGEERSLAFALESFGDEAVTIREWQTGAPERVRLPAVTGPVTVEKGGEFQLPVVLVAPRDSGPFEYRILVHSDATNLRGALELRLSGEIEPDYAPHPPRNLERVAYPVLEPEFGLEIRAREGVPAFTVARAMGHERYFDVVTLGSAEPGPRQAIRLRLRRDAPTDPQSDAECRIRFLVAPGAIEVAWPVRLRLYPPIHAQPGDLHLGTVQQGAEREAEIALSAIQGRTFRVTGASAERGLVRVDVKDAKPGGFWRVGVALPRGVPQGLLVDRVVIETDDPVVPRIIVPVRADVR